jgi:hypothetical protein
MRNPLGFAEIEPSPPAIMNLVRRAGDLSDGAARQSFNKLPNKP